MNRVKFLIVTLVSVALFASCNKDDSASLTLDKTALYFSSWSDAAQTISYVTSNSHKVGIGTISEGWTAIVNENSRTITVWPVGATTEGVTNDELAKEGSVVINALNAENQATSCYVNLYIAEREELDEMGLANCYVICKPSVSYSFDVMHRPDGEALATSDVKLLWQSNPDVVKNVAFVDGKAMFYVYASEQNADKVEDTNAVIAAYNRLGEVVWSWHLWIVNENPLTETDRYYDLNGGSKVFMKKNLGAFTNSNGDHDTQKILDSYGMYYQWGRKDPFPRPYYHDATGAESENSYNESGAYLVEQSVEVTASIGTVNYVTKYPMHYITNAASIEEGGNGLGDWLSVADNTLWSDDEKSVYDPCPHGWRVPTKDDFAVLTLADEEDNTSLDVARKQYGWHLTDQNGNEFFYSACGRRRYTDGKIENMNYNAEVYPSTPEPWEGYYWTSTTTDDGKAVSLYFDLKTTRTINKFVPSHSARRANGFQVRCVRIVK